MWRALLWFAERTALAPLLMRRFARSSVARACRCRLALLFARLRLLLRLGGRLNACRPAQFAAVPRLTHARRRRLHRPIRGRGAIDRAIAVRWRRRAPDIALIGCPPLITATAGGVVGRVHVAVIRSCGGS